MLFQDLVEKVSARGPTDTGVEIVIEIKNVIQHDPKTFVEKVEYELAGRRSDLLVGSSRNGFWKINPNADPNEIKAIGFIAALCLKHKIILPFPLEPIYFLAMTGRMNIDSLTEIFREFEPEIYSNLRFLRGNCVRRLNELKLSFSEFCLADEPVNHANLERYIYFKIKTVLYHQNESVLNSFLQGVRLVISPAVINREYTFNSIMEIISPPYDYTAAQLRSACPELDNYKLYSQQYDLFFRAVDNLTRLQRIKLLKLFTNFDRLPEENGKFLITFYQPDRGQHLLPMAMYCYEQLMLTPVESYEQMLRDLIIVADNYD